jgi:predicted nuclease of predicted toxin-antitoxin system
MLRYCFDEHISLAIAEQLRLRGIEVQCPQDVGRANRKISDLDRLTYATSIGHALVSRDRDFTRLHATGSAHAGIVILQTNLSIDAFVEYLELLAKTTEPAQMQISLSTVIGSERHSRVTIGEISRGGS